MTAWTAHYIMLWIAAVTLGLNVGRFRSPSEAKLCAAASMLCGLVLLAMVVFGGPS